MDYGKSFKWFRQKAGLTQKEAAEAIGIKDYQLGNYETNRSEPSIAVLKKMSQLYRVSIDRMLKNNWLKKDLDQVIDDTGNVDIDELIKQLNDITGQLTSANKK